MANGTGSDPSGSSSRRWASEPGLTQAVGGVYITSRCALGPYVRAIRILHDSVDERIRARGVPMTHRSFDLPHAHATR